MRSIAVTVCCFMLAAVSGCGRPPEVVAKDFDVTRVSWPKAEADVGVEEAVNPVGGHFLKGQ